MVDSGTTNTRLRVVENGYVTESFTVKTGAAQGTESVRAAVASLLEKVSHLPAEAVIFSGMITSPSGLLEIPHTPGPVDLARLVPQRHDFPELSPLPFYFIPGVKFEGETPDQGDIIRGEETEIAGYLAHKGNDATRLFLHLGSHHKILRVEGGMLTDSATAITGELLSAAAEHTLLAQSLTLSEDFDPLWAVRGLKLAAAEGLPRALFAVRLMDIRDHLPLEARMSWALGAFAWEDVLLVRNQLEKPVDELVIYGRENFASLLKTVLNHFFPQLSIVTLTHEESEMLAPAGALLAWKQIEGA